MRQLMNALITLSRIIEIAFWLSVACLLLLLFIWGF